MSRNSSLTRWALGAGALAMLAASAYAVRHKTALAEAANPPRGRMLDVDGVRLHVTEHGNPQAPALVLLHGNGSSGLEMELSGLVEAAGQRFRVLVFDRPGYGHSDRPRRMCTPDVQAALILKALAQLKVERPVILAHSWGTLVAQAMALQAPHALKGLVLAGGYYTPAPRFDLLVDSLPALPLLGPLMARTVSPLLSRLMWPMVTWRLFSPAPSLVRRAFLARYPVWMTLRPHALQSSAAEALMLIPQAARLRRHHEDLRVPIVLVAGDQDRLLMTRWHTQRVQRRLVGSRVHTIPGAGHMVHHSAPQALIDAALEVSAMTPPPRGQHLAPPLHLRPVDAWIEPAV